MPSEYLAVLGDILGLVEGGATGISWVETRDATPLPTMHITGPTTESDPTKTVNGSEIV